MADEIIKCAWGHEINGVQPEVDSSKFEVQNPHLIGRSCDCGKFVYTEDKCPVCTGVKWKILWKDKEQYNVPVH